MFDARSKASLPGSFVSGVDAGNGGHREATRQGLGPAEVFQALTQLLTHAQHTKLHRMLTTKLCNNKIPWILTGPDSHRFNNFNTLTRFKH